MKSAHAVIRRVLMTEKGAIQRDEHNQYLFHVPRDANKIDIKRAVEEVFEVGVTNVSTQIRRGKNKRFGRFQGKRPNWKRAIVTLKSGDTIDVFDQV